MASGSDFRGHAIVCCGTLRGEMEVLEQEGFLNADQILFTAPGLHEHPWELEKQLKSRLQRAKANSRNVIVVYGAKCFVDYNNPARDIDAAIREEGSGISRIAANNCVDMLSDAQEREEIAAGQRVYWLTPGWIAHWRYIFRDWDSGKANETFPQHDKAVVLDGIGFFEQYSQDKPEELLAFSDWMRIPIEPHTVFLDRLCRLLSQQVQQQA